VQSHRARTLPTFGMILYLLGGATSASAQLPLLPYGEPALGSFEIVPIFWGDWTATQINNLYAYLTDLADYISLKNAPIMQQPVIAQYGVKGATVAAAIKANQPGSSTYIPPSKYISACPDKPPAVAGTIYFCDPPSIIAGLQKSGAVPLFTSKSLIMLFLGKGYILDPACNCAGYHQAETTSPSFYAVVPLSPPTSAYPGQQLHGVTSHEIFEAATDPYDSFMSQWAWLTAPYDAKGDVYEAADQCAAMITVPWPTSPSGTLSFAQITDDSNGGACSTSGYIPGPLFYPIGVWFNQILVLSVIVEGPVTPPPGTPVEANLGFVDLNGNPIGQSSLVQLIPGQVATLTLNANLVATAQGAHVSVRPVINQVGAFLPAVRLTAEVFDATTGAGAALGSAPTTPGPSFGPQGVAGGQTMRIAVVAPPRAACAATLGFADRTGVAIGPTLPVNLAAGHGATLDLSSNTIGVAASQRVEVQPRVAMHVPTSGTVACAATAEVFDTATGRTATFQSMLAQRSAATATPPNTVDPPRAR
jgi:hypothetical protein